MAGPYGLTTTGPVGKPATQSKSDFDAAFKGIYGESIGSNPDGSIPAANSIGQEVTILVDSESGLWEQWLALYAAFDPDQAVTPELQILCAITGTRQKKAAYSTAIETCVGVIGTQLQPGRVVTVQQLGTRFVSQPMLPTDDPNAPNATLLGVGTMWGVSTAYAVNALVQANAEIWQCIVPGVSSNAGPGPATGGVVDGEFVDGTVTWRPVGASTVGVALVPFQAEDTGPLAASALQLSQIATPVTGWRTAFNALDANMGRVLEGDTALRVRRQQELQGAGGGPADAIQAALLAYEDVEACVVFVNSGDVVNGDGVPAHGVEVLILAPAVSDQILANRVWIAVGAGTATGGGISKTVIDKSGNAQTVSFTRPTPVPIYIVVVTYYDPARWQGADVDAAITAGTQSALLNYGLTYGIGENVRMIPLAAAVTDGPQAITGQPPAPVVPSPAGAQPMPGIVDVLLYLGTAPAPGTSAPITITPRQIATFSRTNISVTPTPEAP